MRYTYHSNHRSRFGNIRVRQHNGRIIAAHLQRHPLDRLRGRRHDPLARGDRAGETDLVDVRVVDQSRAQLVIAAQGLHQPGREDLVGDLDHLQRRVSSMHAVRLSSVTVTAKCTAQHSKLVVLSKSLE